MFRYLSLILIVPILFYMSFPIRRLLGSFEVLASRKALVIIVTVLILLALLFWSRTIFSAGTIFVLYTFLACLLIQIVHIFWKNQTFYNWQIVIAMGITAIVVIIGAFNMNQINQTTYEVATGKNAQTKIALISDLHLGVNMDADEFGKYLRDAKESGAQMLLLGGDIFDESTSDEDLEKTFDNLRALDFEYGIFYVYGNHDSRRYSSGESLSTANLEARFQDAGVRVLKNEYEILPCGVTLIGLVDKSYGNGGIMERGDIGAVIKEALTVAPDNYTIVLDHQPVDFAIKEQAGADLNISGHTHGGQIWPLSLFEKFISSNEQIYGEENFGKMKSITTSGIAGWGYPIRTEGHCEWVIINLTIAR